MSTHPDAAGRRLLAMIPATQRRLDLAGVSTALLEAGDGPPVVILHGVGQFAATWMRLIPELLTTHRVVIPDLPGKGESRVVDGQLDAAHVLAWLGALMGRTCPSPPALVGHEAGGAIAARFARDHDDRISRLVLVDPLGLAPFRPTLRFALAMVGFMARPTEQTFDRFLGQCLVDLAGVHQQLGEAWELLTAYGLEAARTPAMKTAARRLMKEFGVSAIPEADLEQISVATTLIWGRHNPQTRLRVGQAASARYGWPLVVIDDSAADPHIEQPAALLGALQEALDGLPAAPARNPTSRGGP